MPSLETLLPTFIQFPLLLVFVWFTFEMQNRFQKSMEACRKEEAEERVKRDDQWRTFLLDQRQAQTTGLESLSKAQASGLESLSIRMEQMANVLAAINANVNQVMTKFQAHDARAEDISKMVATIDAKSGKP